MADVVPIANRRPRNAVETLDLACDTCAARTFTLLYVPSERVIFGKCTACGHLSDLRVEESEVRNG